MSGARVATFDGCPRAHSASCYWLDSLSPYRRRESAHSIPPKLIPAPPTTFRARSRATLRASSRTLQRQTGLHHCVR